MSARVAVATDSSACLPLSLVERFRIQVAPLQVIVDDAAHDEGEGISPAQVVEALVAKRRVGTSQPGPEVLRRIIARAVDDGAQGLVFVTLSSAMSGTAKAVTALAADAPIPVTVVDSGTVALALGLAVASAAAVAAQGGDAALVAAEAKRAAKASVCVFTIDTLDYLRRGGRVSPAVAAIGNALGVKPVLGVQDGTIAQLERARSSAKARQAVLDKIATRAATYRHPAVGLMGLSGDDALLTEAARLLRTRSDWPMVTSVLSAALAAHAGPGALAAVAVDCHPAVLDAIG